MACHLFNFRCAYTYNKLFENGLNCKEPVLRVPISHLLKMFLEVEFGIHQMRCILVLLYKCYRQEDSNLLIARMKVKDNKETKQVNFRVYPGCYTYKWLYIWVQSLVENRALTFFFNTEFPYFFFMDDFFWQMWSFWALWFCYEILQWFS